MSRIILNHPPIYNAISYQGSPSVPWKKWTTQVQQAHNQFFPIYNLELGKSQVPLQKASEYTTAERDSLQSVGNGVSIYNTTTSKMNWYENGAWVEKS